MAKGDATITSLGSFKPHYGFKVKPLTVACDNQYKTGGYAIDLSVYGISVIWGDVVLAAAAQHGYMFKYDVTNKKMLAYYCDYDAVADGGLIEVPDTTAIGGGSAFTIKVTVMGYGG